MAKIVKAETTFTIRSNYAGFGSCGSQIFLASRTAPAPNDENATPCASSRLAKTVVGCNDPASWIGGTPPESAVTNNVIIRTATAAEQDALEAFQLRASLTNEGDREALLANPDAIAIPLEQIAAGRVFVAELGGATVGFSAIEPRSNGETELDALFVDPNVRRRGIGYLMVEYCAGVARRRGSKALHVIGNPHAEEFYLACGFKQTGTIETRFGVGLLMQKEL